MARTRIRMSRSLAVLFVGFALLVPAAAEAKCILCEYDVIWKCALKDENGGDECFTLFGGCSVSGSCIHTPPPPPPDPDPDPDPKPDPDTAFWESQMGFFDLQPTQPCYPLCGGFPASIPISEAYDFASIKAKIAELSGEPASSVLVSDRGFFASRAPLLNRGTAGWVIDSNEGFMLRRDVNELDGSVRVRVCRFAVGEPAELVSDQAVTSSGTLLVRVPLGARDVVLAFKEQLLTQPEFEANLDADQAAWESDFQANATGSPWVVSIGHAATACE